MNEKKSAREVLTPEALALLRQIADSGSFAAAARSAGLAPSAVTYRVRQIEDALDVLLFDRSGRQAQLTDAGRELLREGARLLDEWEAMANRVKRVATGWEPQFTIAVDSIVDPLTMMELCEAFLAQKPPTQLRLRNETLSGTLEALASGQADLALGVMAEAASQLGLQVKPLGSQQFVFAVAPHHPLARAAEPLTEAVIRPHRVVAAADSVQRGRGVSIGGLVGQDVFTVDGLPAKLEAQLRGLGCGFLPDGMARPYIETGRLVEKQVERPNYEVHISYAWRRQAASARGRALQWWLAQLDSPTTRRALLRGR